MRRPYRLDVGRFYSFPPKPCKLSVYFTLLVNAPVNLIAKPLKLIKTRKLARFLHEYGYANRRLNTVIGRAAMGWHRRVSRYEEYNYDIVGGGCWADSSRHHPHHHHPRPRLLGLGVMRRRRAA